MILHKSRPRGRKMKFYDFWAEAIERKWVDETKVQPGPTSAEKELDFLRFAFDQIATRPVKRILDLACGYGRLAIPLAKAGYSVVAKDSNLKMIELSRKRSFEARVKIDFRVGDMRNLKSVKEFDAVVVTYSLDYLVKDKDLAGTLRAVFDALREGGVLVAAVPNPYHSLKKFTDDGSDESEEKGTKIHEVWKKEFNELTGLNNLHEFFTVRESEKEGRFELRESFRYYNYGELRNFLSAAGFHDVKCFGSFEERNEAELEARLLIFVARKS